MELTLKEQKILWVCLNQAQELGLRSVSQLLSQLDKIDNETLRDVSVDKLDIPDWLKQTSDEYNVINNLKTKLCKDLE